jgi:hypothetical protein
MPVLEHIHAPVRTPAPLVPVEVDERAARRSLRDQIARLERRLGTALASAPPALHLDVGVDAHGGARLLGLAELESLRDAMAARVGEVRRALARRAEVEEANRRLVERMMLDPAAHRFVRVSREDVGERGCGGWEVRPRLGLLGMLAGWWEVKLSSGCPLAMAYHHRRRREPWGQHALLELFLTVLVLAVLVAGAIVFLFVYHDFPLRVS